MRYACPKCRCGCMFEEKNKLICVNCGAEVPKWQAAGVKHEHPYRTYTTGSGTRPVTVNRQSTVRPPQPTVRPSQNTGMPGPRPAGAAPKTPAPKKKSGTGCGTMILIYIVIGVLFAIFRNLG